MYPFRSPFHSRHWACSDSLLPGLPASLYLKKLCPGNRFPDNPCRLCSGVLVGGQAVEPAADRGGLPGNRAGLTIERLAVQQAVRDQEGAAVILQIGHSPSDGIIAEIMPFLFAAPAVMLLIVQGPVHCVLCTDSDIPAVINDCFIVFPVGFCQLLIQFGIFQHIPFLDGIVIHGAELVSDHFCLRIGTESDTGPFRTDSGRQGIVLCYDRLRQLRRILRLACCRSDHAPCESKADCQAKGSQLFPFFFHISSFRLDQTVLSLQRPLSPGQRRHCSVIDSAQV